MREHGTAAAYQTHMRASERPCEACAEAHKINMRAHRWKVMEAEGWKLLSTVEGSEDALRVYEKDGRLKGVLQ